MTYVCTIPAVPPSMNVWQRMHWAEKVKGQEAWTELLQGFLNQKGNAIPRHLGCIDIYAVIGFKVNRRRDSDNYLTPLNKWTQDYLVYLGVIPDDTSEHCTFHPPSIVIGPEEQTVLMVVKRK
jgi:hypothetical protein